MNYIGKEPGSGITTGIKEETPFLRQHIGQIEDAVHELEQVLDSSLGKFIEAGIKTELQEKESGKEQRYDPDSLFGRTELLNKRMRKLLDSQRLLFHNINTII